jgi:hypothetical protein
MENKCEVAHMTLNVMAITSHDPRSYVGIYSLKEERDMASAWHELKETFTDDLAAYCLQRARKGECSLEATALAAEIGMSKAPLWRRLIIWRALSGIGEQSRGICEGLVRSRSRS